MGTVDLGSAHDLGSGKNDGGEHNACGSQDWPGLKIA